MVLGNVAIVVGSGTLQPVVIFDSRSGRGGGRAWRGFLYPLLGFFRFSLALGQRPCEYATHVVPWGGEIEPNPLQINLVYTTLVYCIDMACSVN